MSISPAAVLFLGLLTAAGQLVVVAAIGLELGSRVSPAIARAETALLADVRGQALALAWLVALLSMLGSLFLSEVAGFPPCNLCWYQRIAMYPLVVVLGIAAWRRDVAGARIYALPLVAIGFVLALYHYVIQWFPSFESRACTAAVPCTMSPIWEFRYISIPLMAATAFALIGVLLVVADRQESESDDTTHEEQDED